MSKTTENQPKQPETGELTKVEKEKNQEKTLENVENEKKNNPASNNPASNTSKEPKEDEKPKEENKNSIKEESKIKDQQLANKAQNQKNPIVDQKKEAPLGKENNVDKPKEQTKQKVKEEAVTKEDKKVPSKNSEKNGPSTNTSTAKVINCVSRKPKVFHSLKVKPKFGLICIYKRQSYPLRIYKDITFDGLIPKINEELDLKNKKFEIIYKNATLPLQEKSNTNVWDLVCHDKQPIFEIQKVYEENPLIIKNYDYKLSIDGIKDIPDLYKQIDYFFTNLLISKDYKIEHYSQTKVLIGFSCQEYLYDFNKFLNYLKLTDALYSVVTVKKFIDKPQKIFVNKSISNVKPYQSAFKNKVHPIKKKSVPKFSSALYINVSGPYMSAEELRRVEYKKNKKKWVSSKDFITAVGSNCKFSNKYLD